MDTVGIQSHLDHILHNYIIKSVVKIDSVIGMHLKLYIFVSAVLKNQRMLWGSCVIRFAWVTLDIKQLVYNRRFFLMVTDQEENGCHVPDLVPKEGISYKMKVIYVVSLVILKTKDVRLHSLNTCFLYGFVVVEGACDV